MGIESDQRAGAVRVDPNSIVSRPEDLTPAISMLTDAFRKGAVNADNLIERYGQKARVTDQAEIAKARVETQAAKAISPELIQMRVQAEQGGLEGQIAQQQLNKETRDVREKAEKMKFGRAIDELEYGLPADMVQSYAMEYPEIVKPVYGANGRVDNPEEVKKQLGYAVRAKRFLDNAAELSKSFETKEITLESGQKALQTVWKNTSVPVPKGLVDIATQAQTGKLSGLFGGAPGQMAPAAGGVAAPPVIDWNAPAVPSGQAAPTPGIPTAKSATEAIAKLEVGTTTPEGLLITTAPGMGESKTTEIESKSNKFAHRMELSEAQYTRALQAGVDPTSPNLQAQKQLLGIAQKVPVAGAYVANMVSNEAKEYDAATKAFTSAMLRDESGAAIRDEEREEYERTFFPIAGDPPSVVANKAKQRAAATAALKQVATRKMTEADYEKYIQEISGLQFPLETSVLAEEAGSSPSAPAPAGVTPKAPRVQRYKSIREVPPDVKVFWLEGESLPRRRN